MEKGTPQSIGSIEILECFGRGQGELKASLGLNILHHNLIQKVESQKINEANIRASYGTDLVHAAFSVNNKKVMICMIVESVMAYETVVFKANMH